MIDLNGADLNLLVSLDALIEEGNVTKAAARLNVSQPALSAQLARLRDIFRDPLLVSSKTGRGMIPTARALELRGPLRGALKDSSRASSSVRRHSIRRRVRGLPWRRCDRAPESGGPRDQTATGMSQMRRNRTRSYWAASSDTSPVSLIVGRECHRIRSRRRNVIGPAAELNRCDIPTASGPGECEAVNVGRILKRLLA